MTKLSDILQQNAVGLGPFKMAQISDLPAVGLTLLQQTTAQGQLSVLTNNLLATTSTAATLSGALSVTGASTLAAVTMSGTASVSGLLTASGGLTTGTGAITTGTITSTIFNTTGASGQFVVSDRTASNTGLGIFYRNNGTNYLYDSTNGNNVIGYNSTSIALNQPTTVTGLLTSSSLNTNALSASNISAVSVYSYAYTSINAQGAWLQWNRDGGGGGSWLVNQRGGGSGGINFGEATTANAYTESAFIAPSGGTSRLASTLVLSSNLSLNANQIWLPGSATLYVQNTGTGPLDLCNGGGPTTVHGTLNVQGSSTFSGSVLVAPNAVNPQFGSATTNGAVGIELGSTTTAGSAYLDLHSSGTGSDYDVRLIATGGSSTAGAGNLSITANSIAVNGYVSSLNGATLGTYGSLSVAGSKGGYSGVHFNDAGRTLMVQNTAQGTASGVMTGTTWDWYWAGGTLVTGVIPRANVANPAPTTISANATLTAADLDRNFIFSGSGTSYTVTLPSSVPAGWSTGTFTNSDATSVGQVAPPSGTIANDGATVSTLNVAFNQKVRFVYTGSGWAALWTDRSPILMTVNAAAGTASFDFRVPVGYQQLDFSFANIVPSTNAVDFAYRVSGDGGNTFRSAASDYNYQVIYEAGNNSGASTTAFAYQTLIASLSNNASYTVARAAVARGSIDLKYGSVTGVNAGVNSTPLQTTAAFSGYPSAAGTALVTPNYLRFLIQSGTFSCNGWIRGIPTQ